MYPTAPCRFINVPAIFHLSHLRRVPKPLPVVELDVCALEEADPGVVVPLVHLEGVSPGHPLLTSSKAVPSDFPFLKKVIFEPEHFFKAWEKMANEGKISNVNIYYLKVFGEPVLLFVVEVGLELDEGFVLKGGGEVVDALHLGQLQQAPDHIPLRAKWGTVA